MKKSLLIPAFVLLLAILILLFLVVLRPPAVQQPIAFNHRLHTEEVGIECGECHLYYAERASSGLPDGETCRGCHEEPMTESAEEARLLASLENGGELTFRKLFRLPDHVYYSHARHVSVAELGCTECHGDISRTTTPPERPLVRVDMDHCMDCHERLAVTNDCVACHR